MIDDNYPKVTLEQWRALSAVVEQDGYANAAEALGKSQSTVSHHIQRLEESLGTRVLQIKGRKAILTPVGEVVLRRARSMIKEAGHIEQVAGTLAAGVEPEIGIAVDTIFPNQVLLPAFKAFSESFPDTRIELFETVISGVIEKLLNGQAQLAITSMIPQGWLGSHLLSLEMCCVAHPDHPLHHLGRPATYQDLKQHRQLFVRESDQRRQHNPAWVGSEQRITMTTMGTRIQALCEGLGFCWSPVLKIQRELQQGLLKPIELVQDSRSQVNLYLILADEQSAGPATLALAKQIRTKVQKTCL